MGGRLRCAIALFTTTVAVWCAAPALAAFPGGNGKIAYEGHSGNQADIYTVEADGTAQQLLISQAFGPSWSPDGGRLAIDGSGGRGIEVVNADGTERVTLTTEDVFRDDSSPDWAPDAAQIAFARFFGFQKDPFSQLHTIAPDGTGVQGLPIGAGDPAWAPDGSGLAYSLERHDFIEDENGEFVEVVHGDIASSERDGTGRVEITGGLAYDFEPDWSPDGSQIVFSRLGSGLHIVNADGSGLRFLVSGTSPSWSPDGTRIAFAQGGFRESEIYTIAVDGSDERRVTDLDDGISANQPDWERLPAPRREDFKNAAKFCQAERDFWGEAGFRERYGGGANAHGKCVSSNN